MKLNELQLQIDYHGTCDRYHYQNQTEIEEIMSFSKIVSDTYALNEAKLSTLKKELTHSMVEKLTLENAVVRIVTMNSDSQKLKLLQLKIDNIMLQMQAIQLNLFISLNEILEVVEAPLPHLQAEVDAFVPEEHEHSLEALRLAHDVLTRMQYMRDPFATAYTFVTGGDTNKASMAECQRLVE